MIEQSLEAWVIQAKQGNKSALEHVVERIQDKVYGLALKMLWHPEDAQDATQEILIRIITHLGSFRGDSAFLTWVYRISSNTLVSIRKSRLEEQSFTFERFGQDLDEGLSEFQPKEDATEHALLLEEVKIGCTLGMLLCLDRPHRLTYILGEILELDSHEGAAICEITPQAFRKRLSRARSAILQFMKRKCGLVNPDNLCRCRRRVNRAIQIQRIDPHHLLFARDKNEAERFPQLLAEIRNLEDTRRCAALYRSLPAFKSPRKLAEAIGKLMDAKGSNIS